LWPTLDDISGERVFVTMYGLTLLAIRVLLFAVYEYSHRERLYGERENEEKDVVRRTILPVVAAHVVAMLIGLILPRVAVGALLPACCLSHHPVQRTGGVFCSTALDVSTTPARDAVAGWRQHVMDVMQAVARVPNCPQKQES
jgi:hypothetical protein